MTLLSSVRVDAGQLGQEPQHLREDADDRPQQPLLQRRRPHRQQEGLPRRV